MFEVTIKTEFAAAHSLRNYRGACESIHGHNWKVDVYVRSAKVDKAGLAIDFKILKGKTHEIIAGLDHCYINDREPFTELSPSSENIAKYIYDNLKTELPPGVTLHKVTVWETDVDAASYLEEGEG